MRNQASLHSKNQDELYDTGMSMGKRIREARLRANITQVQLAVCVGVSDKAVSQWELDKTVPEANNLRQLAKCLQTDPTYLLGDASPITDFQPSDKRRLNLNPSHPWPEDEFTADIPEIDILGGAAYGGGFGQEENITDSSGTQISQDVVRARWGIPIPFLRDELGTRPSRVHILPVRGDSMEDALFEGDRVIIDLDDTDPGTDGIFAFRDETGGIRIKQLEWVRGAPDGATIRCTSRNKNYGPFSLLLADPVLILGRVVCKITRV